MSQRRYLRRLAIWSTLYSDLHTLRGVALGRGRFPTRKEGFYLGMQMIQGMDRRYQWSHKTLVSLCIVKLDVAAGTCDSVISLAQLPGIAQLCIVEGLFQFQFTSCGHPSPAWTNPSSKASPPASHG